MSCKKFLSFICGAIVPFARVRGNFSGFFFASADGNRSATGLWDSSVYRAVLLCLLISGTAFGASESRETTDKFKQVQRHIRALQEEMRDTQTQYGQLQRDLKHTEEKIGETAEQLEKLPGQLRARRQSLKALEARKREQEKLRNEQRKTLARQVRSAYITGRQDYLKILFNQENPVSVGRALTYYDYFNRLRVKRIARFNVILERIRVLKSDIRLKTAAIARLLDTQTAKKRKLETSYQTRRGILARLGKALQSQEMELGHLQQDKRRLKMLLGALRENLPDLPALPEHLAFYKRKGKLSRPVAGRILNRYGTSRNIGSLKWQGILISAVLGQKVHSVSAGRVVFADWLRNFGQLLIIEHDDGYMSLYGHNQSLYKKNGDLVKTRELIASAGKSGGQDDPVLYFEIRHKGVPVNPMPWFR
ncbi:MAG: peptidoglycan DD-metalloendopeptidase family protein [Gammaproteobacteria bacterium]|nr:peptidoglycan DD-metalloendopeptidase family protein [Gammaproteobacteria bacterium]